MTKLGKCFKQSFLNAERQKLLVKQCTKKKEDFHLIKNFKFPNIKKITMWKRQVIFLEMIISLRQELNFSLFFNEKLLNILFINSFSM